MSRLKTSSRWRAVLVVEGVPVGHDHPAAVELGSHLLGEDPALSFTSPRARAVMATSCWRG